ncbi:MAG: LysM peptidoglycan-binding domain-containing protein [Victivallales bacterium]|nr:LysM peptidoglycan-binding domain-containing protein [Victivallales bacterium]
MSKNLVVATAMAALAVSGMLGAGCSSNKAPAAKPTKLTILSDRECIPPPYASPSQHSFNKKAQEASQPPATIKGEDTFVPPPENNFTPFAPNQGGEPPIFTGTTETPAQGGKVEAEPAPKKSAPAKKPVAKPARTYKVKKGDYLSVIAYMFKVSTQDLAAENNMELNATLREGRVLNLPSYALETPRPRPAIKKKPAPAKAPAKANGKQVKKTEAKASSATDGDFYVVQPNDNLWTIVRKNKVKEADVRALNPQIKDFSKLQIGDKIRLRASSTSAPGTGAPAKVSPAPAAEGAPIAPIQIGAQVTEATPVAPVDNAPAPPAPEVKPAQLSPALNFNTLPMNPATEAPSANPGTATAE